MIQKTECPEEGEEGKKRLTSSHNKLSKCPVATLQQNEVVTMQHN